MAFASVASLSQTIDLILNYHQHSISHQFINKITYLNKHIIFLQSFLEDSPDEAQAWEERIREVTNEAEDIIELLLSDSLLDSAVGSSNSKLKRGKSELGCDLDDLETVTKEIESVARGVRERHRESIGSLNDDLMKIVDRLYGGTRGLQVIPIVGRGGIGKTTLARSAYNHPFIVKHFEYRVWVTVSQNCSWERVISGLVGAIKNISDCSEDEGLEIVRKTLSSKKRYLIVLDDIWSVEVWDKLESIFPTNFYGNRILITTRLSDVASRVWIYGHIHRMRGMDLDQSWYMLRQKIFVGGHCPPKLEYMGKMIAGRCRGVPLAIEGVSGILAVNQTLAAWEDIVENMKISIDCEDDDEHLLQTLHFSYTYLPHRLRPCLLYLGMFPEDHDIRVSKLIKLWVAEGFLNENESQSFEETGEDCLEDLVKRSLVSIRKRKCNGRIKSVGIHDVMREMCMRQAHADNFFVHVWRNFLPVEATQLERRVSVFENNHHILQNVNGSAVRTIISWVGNRQGFQGSLGCSRLLRILDFSNVDDFRPDDKFDLPPKLFEQFHLRYLDFYSLYRIPKAISKLENLQTLIMNSRKYKRLMLKLPEVIWRMRQLRHLVVNWCVLPNYKEGLFALENLQTLTEAVHLKCSRVNMKMIPNLKKLGIFLRHERYALEDCELRNLVFLQKLEILKIQAQGPRSLKIKPVFIRTLKKLSLSGVGFPWKDMKIVGLLPNLQVLKLRNHACSGRTWETSKRGFSELRFLMIKHSSLEHWITKTSHFPRLQCLVLHYCRHLREIPNDIGEIPTLQLIVVDDYNASLRDSAKRTQEQQKKLGNNSLQIRVV